MRQAFLIYSSNGEIKVDCKTGEIIVNIPNDDADDHFKSIKKFDLDEYKKYYNTDIKSDDRLDILAFGYWYGDDNKYEPPAQDWRNLIAELNETYWKND